MALIATGTNFVYYADARVARLAQPITAGQLDLTAIVTASNTNVIYEVPFPGASYRSYAPGATFAGFFEFTPGRCYLVVAKADFELPGVSDPATPLLIGSGGTGNVSFADTLAATGIANTVQANGITLIGLNGDELHYNAATGSQTPCSMNLYLGFVSESNQVAAIGFPAAYAGQRFGYRTGGALYNGTNLIFTPLGEIVVNAQ